MKSNNYRTACKRFTSERAWKPFMSRVPLMPVGVNEIGKALKNYKRKDKQFQFI